MPAGMLEEMQRRTIASLQQYYTGPALGQRISVINSHIAGDASGAVRYLGGGMDSIAFSDVQIGSSQAIVTARAVVWNKVGQQQGSKLAIATPRGPVDYTFTLSKAGSQWLITSEDVAFPPGSEP